MSQHTQQLSQGKKIRLKIGEKKNLTYLSALSDSSRTCPSSRSRSSEFCRRCHLLFLCRLGCKPPSRPCDCDEMSQHTKHLRQGKKIRILFFNLTDLSARSVSTGIQKCQSSLLPISLLFYRRCRWQACCRRCSMIQSGPCVFDEMCKHAKQLRQIDEKKISQI